MARRFEQIWHASKAVIAKYTRYFPLKWSALVAIASSQLVFTFGFAVTFVPMIPDVFGGPSFANITTYFGGLIFLGAVATLAAATPQIIRLKKFTDFKENGYVMADLIEQFEKFSFGEEARRVHKESKKPKNEAKGADAIDVRDENDDVGEDGDGDRDQEGTEGKNVDVSEVEATVDDGDKKHTLCLMEDLVSNVDARSFRFVYRTIDVSEKTHTVRQVVTYLLVSSLALLVVSHLSRAIDIVFF